MIEKFNFYDVYGYFLPGLVFLAVLWLPFGIVQKTWPGGEWGSAIALLALAYLVGHFLQTIATNALPSRLADGQRYPSDAALDPAFKETKAKLPDQMRIKIEAIVREEFGLELRVDEVGNEKIDKVRNNAFSLARSVLSREKGVSYAEQFQGMYALTRGLVVALGFGFAYILGWSASSFIETACSIRAIYFGIIGAMILVVIVSSIVALRRHLKETKRIALEKAAWILMHFPLLGAGYLAGQSYVIETGATTCRRGAMFGVIALGMLLSSLRFYSAYKFFASHFAVTVWRDFLAFNALRQGKVQ